MFHWVLLLFELSSCVIIRIPIDPTQDRPHVLSHHNIHPHRLIQDEKGSAYLAGVDDPGPYQVYEPKIEWNDECVQLETLTKIPPTGFWEHRVKGPFSAEVKHAGPDSEARERILRLENILSIHACQTRESHRKWYNAPIKVRQTFTYVQLQDWAARNKLNGENITVLLADTGIYYDHIQFGLSNTIPPNYLLPHSPFTKETSEHPRIDAIFIKKGWNDLPNDYIKSCLIRDLRGHGSHCAGILAGERGSVGLAGKAKILMVVNALLSSHANETCKAARGLSGLDYYDVATIFDAGYSPVVLSNSWGSPTILPHLYGVENYIHDQTVYDHPQVLMLFSAGNEGQKAFSVQALSHNILAVGSTKDSLEMSSFSSAGPTIDRQGQMTVHVVTNGQDVLSVSIRTVYDHVYKTGTSMATPLAAGIATLFKEWMLRQGLDASGSMLRTLMIHCAIPLPETDKTAQGFGFLQPALITDSGALRAFEYTINTSNAQIVVGQITASRSEIFRISATWYTPPGAAIENQASISCVKNGQFQYNRSDEYKCLLQMTIHLKMGDNVECYVNFIRALNNTAGFNIAVATSTWSLKYVYIKEDVTSELVGNPLYGAWELEIENDNGDNKVTLVGRSWFARDWAKAIAYLDAAWYILIFFILFAGVGVIYLAGRIMSSMAPSHSKNA